MSDSTLALNDWPQIFDHLVKRYLGDQSFGPDEASVLIDYVQRKGVNPDDLGVAWEMYNLTSDAWSGDAKKRLSDFFTQGTLLSQGRQVFFGQEIPRAMVHSDLPALDDFLNGAIEPYSIGVLSKQLSGSRRRCSLKRPR